MSKAKDAKGIEVGLMKPSKRFSKISLGFPTSPAVSARLLMVIEYEEIPEFSEVEELIDKARELGHPIVARFESLQPLAKDLV